MWFNGKGSRPVTSFHVNGIWGGIYAFSKLIARVHNGSI